MAQTPPSQQLQAGVQVLNPFELETDLGPYATVAEANAAIITAKRFPGKKIKIVVANVPTEYWWSGGIADVNLIAISTGGGGGLTSFNGRTVASAVPTSGDYDAFYYTKLQSDTAYQAKFGNQAANLIYAGPVSGAAGLPSFRALVNTDLPATLVGKEIGAIISDDFNRASLGASYTNIGSATVGIASNKLALSGGDGTYANYVLRNDWYSQFKEWVVDFDFTLDSTGTGIGFIIKSSGVGTSDGLFKIDQTGKIYIDYNFPTLTNAINSGANVLSFTSITDVLHARITRSKNSFTFTVWNVTTNSAQLAVTAAMDLTGAGFATAAPIPRFGFVQLGGNNTIDNWTYGTNIIERPEMGAMGDSLTDGFNAGTSGLDYIGHVEKGIKSRIVKLSTSGNKSSDLVLGLPELGLLKPKYVLILIGANDAVAVVPLATYQSNINSIIAYCRIIGTIPIFITAAPVTTTSVNTLLDTYNTWIINTVGAVWGFQVIDISTFLKQGGTALATSYSSDGIHWKFNGHAGVGSIVTTALFSKFQGLSFSFRDDGRNICIGTTNFTTPTRHDSPTYRGFFVGDNNYIHAETIGGQEGLILGANRTILNGLQTCQDVAKPAWWVHQSHGLDTWKVVRAPATAGTISQSTAMEIKGTATAGYHNFGFNQAANAGYTYDFYNPNAGNTTLRLNSLNTPTFGFAEVSINGVQISYISPNGSWVSNSANNTTNGRGLLCLGSNPISPGTNYLLIRTGIAPTGVQADGFVSYSTDRGGAAGKAGMTLTTEDATKHIFSDRVGLGTLTPNAYATIKPGDHNTPGFSLSLQAIISIVGNGTVININFAVQPQAPYTVGQNVKLIGNSNPLYNGTFAVASCVTNGMTLTSSATGTSATLGFIGALTTALVDGAIEYDSTDLFFTSQGVRRKLTGQAIKGNFTATGTATSTFTVTIPTQANNTYVVNPVPENMLSAASFYVSNKTTTSYDINTLTAVTGVVAFGWTLVP